MHIAAVPRVLQLLPDDIGTAEAGRAVATAAALRRAGGEMVVAGGPPRIEPLLSRAGIDHRPYAPARASLFQMSATQALLDTVHQRGLGLVHVHGLAGGLAAKAFAEAASLPLLMTCEAPPRAPTLWSRRGGRKHLAGRPIIVRTEHHAECLRRDHGLPADAVRVIRPGLDLDAHDPAQVSQARRLALLRRWGLTEDTRPIILVPGASADPGWLANVLTAAARPDAPEARWCLVGPRAPAPHVGAHIARHRAQARVTWVGGCGDWTAAYALASLVVSLPGPDAALCDHLLAAQAMGRPVVAPDSGCQPEALLPGKTGWLVRPRDPGSLAYAASAALDRDPVLQDAMTAAGRGFVAERFSLAAMQAATLALYREVEGARLI